VYIRDVIVLFGRARCGKGELADRFQRNHGFTQFGYMNALYRLHQAAYGVVLDKEQDVRPFLQEVGTNIIRQFDPDFHTRCLIREAKRYIADHYPLPALDIVINDARMPREGNHGEGQLPKLIEEIIGRPPRCVISCFVQTSSEVQAHVMGKAEYEEFVESGRSEHVTEPKEIDTDITLHNRIVGQQAYSTFLDTAETVILAKLRAGIRGRCPAQRDQVIIKDSKESSNGGK